MRLTHDEAARFKAAVRVEYNDRNATPMRECDYIAWVPGMEEEFATTWGRTPEEARADMFERIGEAVEDGLAPRSTGEQFMEDPL